MSLMNLLRSAYTLIFLFAAVGIVNAQGSNIGKSVIREGHAAIVDEKIATARKEALNFALRSTIEYVMESMIDANQRDRYAQLIERQIFSDVFTYILKYEVLKESNIDGQSYALSVKADVDSDKLEQELDRIGVLQYRLSSPHIVFMLSERLPETKLMNEVRISETVIRRALIKSGLFLVSDDMRSDDVVPNERQYSYGDDIGKAMTIGAELGGDIVVFGISKVKLEEPSDRKNSKMKNIRVSIELKAVKLDNGILLSESSASAVYPHSNMLIAAERAIGKASVKVVKKLSDDLLSRWKTEVNAGRQVTLKVSNVTNLTQFNKIKNSLKYYLTGHVEVESRAFDGNRAEYSVTAQTTGYKMASQLEGKKFEEFNIRILSSSLHTLSVTLVRQ